jgi:hypothetical protein
MLSTMYTARVDRVLASDYDGFAIPQLKFA